MGLFATKPYEVGNSILVEEAYSWVTFRDNGPNICHTCFKFSKSLKKCSQCKFARYCGLDCQKKAWKENSHRWECKAIASSVEAKIPSIVRLAALFLFRALNSNDKDIRLVDRCRSFPYSYSNMDSRSDENDVDVLSRQRVDCLVEDLLRFIRLSHYPQHEVSELFEDNFVASLIRMLEMNAHTIYDSELNTLGVGFFPKASFMNHDCRPNCVALFTGGFHSVSGKPISIHIRCIRPIEAGEEIVISYLDVCLSWMDRLEWLKEHYQFECCCSRCKEESSLTIQQYSEKLVDWKSDWKFMNRMIVLSEREERASNMLRSFEYMNEAWDKCCLCIQTLYPNSPIFHWKQIQIASRLSYLCIVLKKYSQATEYLELYMKLIRDKPEWNYFPTVALEMLKLGKLYAYLGNLASAKKYLEKAKRIYANLVVKEDPIYQNCEKALYKVSIEYDWIVQQAENDVDGQLGIA
ncbi:SET and MYND domain-containing protein [Galdieria sulphuraria]|uniref:SET and MYND domain-containing protein n=1 Tax=Galdieria sulphuraria TaxID=130081 RepID=M2XB38_GALSU|nr:SET and MYND domain-containing protein [Galdieria sulphuraria]EME27122.1 SET and MYND domain-containing protein [Galdieria sulphuraria]|eukprot:XP_005703642.1 SET and MYND domain-containing protein [Galdieria sulphuraria]